MTILYDTIGKTYTATRAADPRIVDKLIELFGLDRGARILDIGAGSGNYSQAMAKAGFGVTAIEPSKIMRDQGKKHPNLQWREGFAEDLPFDDDSFDGVMMTLCVHHFTDREKALDEALRIVGTGPVVIFTYDIDLESAFWLFDYFPAFRTKDKEWFASLNIITDYLEQENFRPVSMVRFPLPNDLIDHFAAAGWARPEIYLQDEYRGGISSFSNVEETAVTVGLKKLEEDLSNGRWDEKYGYVRQLNTLDVGYVFLKF